MTQLPVVSARVSNNPVVPNASGAIVNPAALPPADIEALYVHIPFCFHKCHYCDFYSITRQTPERMDAFVDLILREAEFWTSPAAGPKPRLRTVFFGGGTPSLLPANSMARLLAGLKNRFDFSGIEEWTIEVNPATAELEYCRMLRKAGVDRLSFGAQSFNLPELATLERHHDPSDVPRSIALAREAGFTRLNVDLIYAVPGQDLESWAMSLNAALALGTPHVSAYNLTYESNTPMAVKKRLGRLVPIEELAELEMFHHARRSLAAAGLQPYEISNYAAPGEACRHNLVYWTGGNYIGLGPSAASHVEGHRWRNRPHLREWEEAITGGHVPATDVEILSPSQRAGELAMLMLRLSGGLNYAAFAAKTGLDARTVFADQVNRLGGPGLLTADANAIRLTESGLNVADAVAAEFLSPA
ncbi:MAG: coproporphyrinogen oxidase, anaerobic [Phycisphaerales bacterium]|nr:coproporphyrinogen oxidase, anaerobic [Phycisphaerales bacterium]